jgi:hypothetical protein
MRLRTLGVTAALGCALLSDPGAAPAQTVLNPQEAAKIVAIEDLRVSPAGVSGVVVNRTPHIIRDVEILVQYHWLWNNEFKPGTDSPGQTVVLRIDKPLQPGQSAPFSHTLSIAGDRKDGRFVPEATVGAFAVVVPPK